MRGTLCRPTGALRAPSGGAPALSPRAPHHIPEPPPTGLPRGSWRGRRPRPHPHPLLPAEPEASTGAWPWHQPRPHRSPAPHRWGTAVIWQGGHVGSLGRGWRGGLWAWTDSHTREELWAWAWLLLSLCPQSGLRRKAQLSGDTRQGREAGRRGWGAGEEGEAGLTAWGPCGAEKDPSGLRDRLQGLLGSVSAHRLWAAAGPQDPTRPLRAPPGRGSSWIQGQPRLEGGCPGLDSRGSWPPRPRGPARRRVHCPALGVEPLPEGELDFGWKGPVRPPQQRGEPGKAGRDRQT